ncbi:MAG TPA: SpoIIE family protein phosphatase, partial [Thermoanaerobaculia bacterium]|nr:SpoIIE family protein phosphatase [Thermoanaerobaculia bacterium]
LGVRLDLQVKVSATDLESGDQLFLFSDGVVEARAERGDEPFGFSRLEESLARHAQAGPRALRDGVLDDLSRFSGRERRDDDLTLLVLKVP